MIQSYFCTQKWSNLLKLNTSFKGNLSLIQNKFFFHREIWPCIYAVLPQGKVQLKFKVKNL